LVTLLGPKLSRKLRQANSSATGFRETLVPFYLLAMEGSSQFGPKKSRHRNPRGSKGSPIITSAPVYHISRTISLGSTHRAKRQLHTRVPAQPHLHIEHKRLHSARNRENACHYYESRPSPPGASQSSRVQDRACATLHKTGAPPFHRAVKAAAPPENSPRQANFPPEPRRGHNPIRTGRHLGPPLSPTAKRRTQLARGS